MHRRFWVFIAHTMKPLNSALVPKGPSLLATAIGPRFLISTLSSCGSFSFARDRGRLMLGQGFRPSRRRSCPPCRSLGGGENVNAVSFQQEEMSTASQPYIHFIENGFNSIESQLAARIETQAQRDGRRGLSTEIPSNNYAGLEIAFGMQPAVSKATPPGRNPSRPELQSLHAQGIVADSDAGALDEAKSTAVAAIPPHRRSDAVLLSEHGTVTAMGPNQSE